MPTLLKEVILLASTSDLSTWKEKFHTLENQRIENLSTDKIREERNLFKHLEPFHDFLSTVRPIRPYIPKYNTFKREKNEDYHLEIGDEAFDQANIHVNQVRSRLMAKKFQLTPETLVDIFSEEKKQEYIYLTRQWMSKHVPQDESFFTLLKEHPAVYNYSHLAHWNQEQQTDIMRQLWGEQETITLTTDAVLQESLYCIKKLYQKERKKQEKLEFSGKEFVFPSLPQDHIFLQLYLYFLSLIDQWLFDEETRKEEPVLAQYLEANPPSNKEQHFPIEHVGYFAQNYFIPWKYTIYMQLHEDQLVRIIQPWEVIQDNRVKNTKQFSRLRRNHQQIETHKKNVIYGRQLLSGTQTTLKEEAMDQHVEELEKAVGKKQNFYNNEKKRFLLSAKQSELEAIQNYLQRYAWRLQMQRKVNQFFKERVLILPH